MDIKIDRREQRRLATREQLLEAAEQVFSTLGFQQASIQDITDAANLSKRTFYLHFADKDALIEALAQQHFVKIHQAALAHKVDGLPHREMHRRTMEAIFHYCAQHPDLMQAIMGRDASYKLNAMAREYIAATMENELEANCVFRPDAFVPPQIVAQAIAGVIFQFVRWWVMNPGRYAPEEMAQMCESVLFDGIEINFEEPSQQPETEV